MPVRRLWRTTTFRLATLFFAVFALGIGLLLGLVYFETASYLTARVDRALETEADILRESGPELIIQRFQREGARDPLNDFGLFSAGGERIAGQTRLGPTTLPPDGRPRDVPASASAAPRRALAERMPWGEVLVVERDTSQLVELRRIILQALLLSGAAIAVLGLASALALGIRPLRRIQAMQSVTDAIISGDFTLRLPVGNGGDELDQLARLVNGMMNEVERLMIQARTVGDGVAHELRTPLTRLRALLDRASRDLDPGDPRRELLEQCVTDADGVLARFRALLRIAAVEVRGRRSQIERVSLVRIVEQIAELYAPLAAERSIEMRVRLPDDPVEVGADGELLFEAISNLVDNALKFTPERGQVQIRLSATGGGPLLEIIDNGPGIAETERSLVTKRFYRSQRDMGVRGHGLGLSLVAAVVDLHGFELSFHDAGPGASVRILCRSRLGAEDRKTDISDR